MTDIRKNYIAGDWITGTAEVENRNPSDLSDLVGTFAQASADQLDQALDAATRAQTEWAGYALERKQAVLMAIGNEMKARADEFGDFQLLARGNRLSILPMTRDQWDQVLNMEKEKPA